MMKIKANFRLYAANKKEIKDLSDSALRKIANNSKDSRSSRAKTELDRRSKDKHSSKALDTTLKIGKGLGKGLATVGVGAVDWITSPSSRVPSLKKFDGTKAERKLKQMQYKEAQDKARQLHRQKFDKLYNAIWN